MRPLVEEDLGGSLALLVAQMMVVFLRRPGGQSQFSAAIRENLRAFIDTGFTALHDVTEHRDGGSLKVFPGAS